MCYFIFKKEIYRFISRITSHVAISGVSIVGVSINTNSQTQIQIKKQDLAESSVQSYIYDCNLLVSDLVRHYINGFKMASLVDGTGSCGIAHSRHWSQTNHLNNLPFKYQIKCQLDNQIQKLLAKHAELSLGNSSKRSHRK